MTSTVRIIDAILQHKNMSRRQLAKAAAIPPSSLQSALERGKNISTDMIQKIANVLQVPVEFLINPEKILKAVQTSPAFLDMLRNNFYKIGGFENLSTEEQNEVIVQFLNQNPDIIELFFWGPPHAVNPDETNAEREKRLGLPEGAISNAPRAEDVEKQNQADMLEAMGKLNIKGQQEAVKRVRELGFVDEYKRRSLSDIWGYDEPGQE